MDSDADDILIRGMKALTEKLGAIDAQRFISMIRRERFDYTKWRRNYFGDVDADDFNRAATDYAKAHPFRPKKPLLPIE